MAESHARAGSFDAARRAAKEYIRRFPDGRRTQELQRWIEP